jgi:hypothetical protein
MTNTTSSFSLPKIQGKFAKSGRRKMEKKQNELRGNKQKGKNKQIKWEKNRMDE